MRERERCVCVCVRERERERGVCVPARARLCVCALVCLHLSECVSVMYLCDECTRGIDSCMICMRQSVTECRYKNLCVYVCHVSLCACSLLHLILVFTLVKIVSGV